MDTSKIIKGVVSNGRYTVTAPIVKEDYGLYLKIEGVELPETYQVDFSNSENSGTSVTMIGNADGVLIPHQFISTGKDVFAFLYHVGEDFGRTVYKFRIPNKVRPDRTDETPTPEEQSVIDQVIASLNDAVDRAEDAEQAIEDMSVSAETLAEGESATVTKTEQEGVVHLAFGIPKGQTGDTPTITASKAGKTTSIYVDGSEVAQIEDGTDGIDGISPSVSVTDITGGHRVVITDKDGEKSFDVEDGATGATPNLTIGTVETLEPAESATASITGTPENPVLNLGIPQGDTGEVTQAEFDELSGEVSDLKEGLNAMSTATSSDVGKALKAKTVTDGKVVEWEFGETGVAVDPTLSIEGKAADAKATGDAIEAVNGELTEFKNSTFIDGRAIADIQPNTSASIVHNSPSGYIHVKSTTSKIYTGSSNFIDLFGLAQGIFTDPASGVVIEVEGNEVYVHGSPTRGFRYDFQRGEFFADGFANHVADFSNFPNNSATYRMCYYQSEDGVTLPTDIYIATLSDSGSLSPKQLAANASDFRMGIANQYLVMYSNTGMSNISIRFKMGLKFKNDTVSIKDTTRMSYGTTQITESGYYQCGELTWTDSTNVYDVVHTESYLQHDPLTANRVYAWFGNSLSQLRELPDLVSDLLNVKIYDCSFAGAPLTYGNPTMYQPTGFMSLCDQIVANDFSGLSSALDAQANAGINVTEKRAHLATLQSLDFNEVTDIVVFSGTNDFKNDYVNATNLVSGFSNALTALLTAYPHLMVYVIAPTWRSVNTGGTSTIPTMEDLVGLIKDVADDFSLPYYDAYHRSGINALTATVYLESDGLHPTAQGDTLLAVKCAKFLQSN